MAERRGRTRYEPDEPLYGRVKTVLTARVLDISATGARVEVGSALRPSAECDVSIPVAGQELRLRARVVRCRALAGTPSETGSLVFRAGLEFVDIDQAAELAIERAYGGGAGERSRQARVEGTGPIKIKVKVEDLARQREGTKK